MAHSAPALSLYAADGRRKYLNAAERGRVLAATGTASAEARTFCLALAYLGCRISEAMALTAGDVQPAAGLVPIRTLLVVREVPAAPDLIKALQGWARPRPAALLWPWGRTTAWVTVKMVMDAAEVRGLPASPKGLRHGFRGPRRNVRRTPQPHSAMAWPRNIATTAIYTNVLGPEKTPGRRTHVELIKRRAAERCGARRQSPANAFAGPRC